MPLVVAERVVGVLDIDSPILARFDKDDRTGLEQFVETLKRQIDWGQI